MKTNFIPRNDRSFLTGLLNLLKNIAAGKRLWFAARWENTTGQKGPWSEIMCVIIP
jgi:hypothetical protein